MNEKRIEPENKRGRKKIGGQTLERFDQNVRSKSTTLTFTISNRREER